MSMPSPSQKASQERRKSSSGATPIPDVLRPHFPDVVITRRTRTESMSCRIVDSVQEGTVKFFCRSKGHGFIDPDDQENQTPLFMHITDIDGEYIPRKGDRVKYRACPMPPRFDKIQAVHIEIIDFTPEVHHKWSDKETPEEFAEDQAALKEEAEMNNKLREKIGMDI